MSFLKSLFGGGKSAAASDVGRRTDYNGFVIEATPYMANGQYQVAGTISKATDGVRKEHKFVRADRFASLEDATNTSIMKGQQMIDQLGDRLFGVE